MHGTGKKNTVERIVKQLKKLGSSADWDRERFTMDEGCSEAVKEVFIRLYDKGYIYKGSRIINWCPVCKTSISDAEVEHVGAGQVISGTSNIRSSVRKADL